MSNLSNHTPFDHEQLFGVPKPIVGVLHLPALPGAPEYDGGGMEPICQYALRDAENLVAGGVNGLIVENAGDVPYLRSELIGPETAACLAVIVDRVKQAMACPVGVICISNATQAALVAALAGGGSFVRANLWTGAYIADAGFVQSPAGELLRYRSMLRARSIAIMADVNVKHGSHAITLDRPVHERAWDAEFFGADILIATGQHTGDPTPIGEIEAIKSGTKLPVYIGSGLTPDNLATLLGVADGAIVGSFFRDGGHWRNPVSPERVRVLMAGVQEVRRGVQGTSGYLGIAP